MAEASFYDRVHVQTATTGTGSSIAVGDAIAGYLTPAEAGVQDGAVVNYVIEDGDDFEFQAGQLYSSSAPSLSRGTPSLSKIGGTVGTSQINLSGNARVLIVPFADDVNALRRVFDTKADIEAAHIPAYVNAVMTAGYASVGDGGGALYTRVATQPTHAGKIQSADGAWWELVSGDRVNVRAFGAVGDYDYDTDSGTDDTAAIANAIAYANANGIRSVYLPNGKYLISAGFTNTTEGLEFIGDGACYADGSLASSIAGSKTIVVCNKSATIDSMFHWKLLADDDTDHPRRGGGMRGILIDCNDTAAKAIEVRSWMSLVFDNVHTIRATYYGWSLGTVANGATHGKYSSCYHTFQNCSHLPLGSAGRAMVLWGAHSRYNFCLSRFFGCTWRGGIDMEDCDSNWFFGCAWDTGLILHADDTGSVSQGSNYPARHNNFFGCQGAIIAKATVAGTRSSFGNVVFGHSMENSVPFPTIEPGADLTVFTTGLDFDGHHGGAIYGASFPGATGRLASAFAVSHESTTTVPWPAPALDPFGMWSAANPTRLTIPSGIKMARMIANVTWDANGAGQRYADIIKNASGVVCRDARTPVTNLATVNSLDTGWLEVEAGQVFELRVNQNSGGPLNILAFETFLQVELR